MSLEDYTVLIHFLSNRPIICVIVTVKYTEEMVKLKTNLLSVVWVIQGTCTVHVWTCTCRYMYMYMHDMYTMYRSVAMYMYLHVHVHVLALG